jgi:WD40 repeat protein
MKLALHQIQEPEPVESLRPQVPAAVAAVVRKLMAKGPEDRYQTASEAAEVLAGILRAANWSPAGAFDALSGDATEVVHAPTLTRLSRAAWSWRRLALAVALAVTTAAVVLVLAWLWNRPARHEHDTEEPPEYVLDRLARERIPPEERVAWQPAVVQVLGEHKGRHWSAVGAVAFSADGKVVYSAANRQLAAWDAGTLRCLRQEPTGHFVRAIGAVGKGEWIFVTDYSTGMAFHSALTLKQTYRPPLCTPKVVSPDGKYGLDGFGNGAVSLLEFGKDPRKGLTEKFGNGPVGVAFSPDGLRFAHTTLGGDVVVRRTDTEAVVKRVRYHRNVVTALAYSPDGSTLAAAGPEEVCLWDVSRDAPPVELAPLMRWAEVGHIETLAFAGESIVALRRNGTAALVLSGPKEAPTKRTIGDPILAVRGLTAMATSPHGALVALGDGQGRVRLWKAGSGEEAVRTTDNQGRVNALLLSPDGARVVTTGVGDRSGQVILWDVEGGRSLKRMARVATNVHAAALSADGESFYVGDDLGTLARCKLAGGEDDELGKVGFGVRALAITPGGELAVAGERGRVVLWDPRSGRITELAGFDAPVAALAAGGKGEQFRLVAAGVKNAKPAPRHPIHVYLASGKLVHSVERQSEQVTKVAVSDDGKYVAVGGITGVRLWAMDRLDAEPVLVWQPRPALPVTALAFFPDGGRLAMANLYGAVEVCTRQGAPVKGWRWQMPGPVTALAVDRRGEYLVTGNGNGTAYVLRLPR